MNLVLRSEIPEDKEDWKAVVSYAAIHSLSDVYSSGIKLGFDEEKLSNQYKTLRTVLNYDDILEDQDLDKLVERDRVSMRELIEIGDIGFLASKFISGKELDDLQENRENIDEKITEQIDENDFDLYWISENNESQEIIEGAISSYVNKPDWLSEKIVQRANFWNERLEEYSDNNY